MDQQFPVTRQMINMQKITFFGMLDNAILLCEQTGRMLSPFIDHAIWLPEGTKKAFRDWLQNSVQGFETVKNIVDTGYSGLEKYIQPSSNSQSRQQKSKYPHSY